MNDFQPPDSLWDFLSFIDFSLANEIYWLLLGMGILCYISIAAFLVTVGNGIYLIARKRYSNWPIVTGTISFLLALSSIYSQYRDSMTSTSDPFSLDREYFAYYANRSLIAFLIGLTAILVGMLPNVVVYVICRRRSRLTRLSAKVNPSDGENGNTPDPV
jgi:hypothetical protein